MLLATAFVLRYQFFTFQSGYIQIDYLRHYSSHQVALHSNLVIFKWSTEKGIISSCFTFQSGYIQIKLFNISFDKLLSFTFQSGYIQILFPIYWHYLLYFLYIPIWLYSNKPALLKATLRQLSLHSNLVIFKLIYTLY